MGKIKNELNLKCFAQLIAHMTGFASIKAWGEVQQLDFFAGSPYTCLLVPLMSMLMQNGLQMCTRKVRDKVAALDDDEEGEEEWHEASEEAENDVMALSVSYLTVQA